MIPVAVLGCLLTAELGARWLGPNLPRHAGSEERAYLKATQMDGRGTGATDLVIVGSSDGAGGLIPDTITQEVPELPNGYNAALAGSRLAVTEAWTDQMVLPLLRPKVVVIAMSPFQILPVSDPAEDPNREAEAAYLDAFRVISSGGVGSIRWNAMRSSALLRYRPWLRDPVLVVRGLAVATGMVDRPVGRLDGEGLGMDFKTEDDPRVIEANTAPTGEVLDYRSKTLPVDQDVLSAEILANTAVGEPDYDDLTDLVETIRRAGGVPVLTLSPVDRSVLADSGLDLGPYDRLVDDIESWGADHGVPVHDVFTVTWPKDDFHDRTHVATSGAERWSRELGSWLSELCQDGKLESAC